MNALTFGIVAEVAFPQIWRVLYVEDDSRVASALMRALNCVVPKAIKIEWITARTLEQALPLLDQPLDALLLDVSLGPPGNVDGLVVLLEARARGLWVPTVIFSAHIDFDAAADIVDLGARGVPKPFGTAQQLYKHLVEGQPGTERGRRLAGWLTQSAPARITARVDHYRRIAVMMAHMQGSMREQIAAIEQARYQLAVEESGGSKRLSAKLLGVSRSTVRRGAAAPPPTRSGVNYRRVTPPEEEDQAPPRGKRSL